MIDTIENILFERQRIAVVANILLLSTHSYSVTYLISNYNIFSTSLNQN